MATVTYEGVLTSFNLTGPLASQSITNLTALIKSGDAYVGSGLF